MRTIVYSKAAIRTLSRIPSNVSRLIRSKIRHGAHAAKIEQYAADPSALGNNVKALRGYDGVSRLRVGDWRVLFSDDGVVIAIIRVASRGDAYEQ